MKEDVNQYFSGLGKDFSRFERLGDTLGRYSSLHSFSLYKFEELHGETQGSNTQMKEAVYQYFPGFRNDFSWFERLRDTLNKMHRLRLENKFCFGSKDVFS